MRVDDNIRLDALSCERHVFLPVGHANGALLAVTGGELIPDLWYSHRPHPHLHELVPLVVVREHNLVDGTIFSPS